MLASFYTYRHIIMDKLYMTVYIARELGSVRTLQIDMMTSTVDKNGL